MEIFLFKRLKNCVGKLYASHFKGIIYLYIRSLNVIAMKLLLAYLTGMVILISCSDAVKVEPVPLIGTWELISATSTTGDSTKSTFNPKVKMIKIINPTHFAFLSHDISGIKDSSTAAFTAGGGTYTLTDSVYTEHLDYFVTREWEGGKFEFVVKISGDTLVQKGIEKVEKLGIDHVIVEKYKRVQVGPIPNPAN